MALPNELILRTFSSLPFKSLLSARAVCSRWRIILPYAELHPTRKAMLKLYIHLVTSPTFLKTRPWVIANLRDFDRKEYLNRLCSQLRHSHSDLPASPIRPGSDFDFTPLPASFAYFVLEWPAKAAICGTWPGLPRFRYPAHLADNVTVREGCSWISVPRISAVLVEDEMENTAYYAPALLIWRGRMGAVWVFLGEGDQKREDEAKDRDQVDKSLSDMAPTSSDYLFNLYGDYVSYLYQHWKSIEQEAERRADQELPVWSVLEEMPVELGGCLEGMTSLGAVTNGLPGPNRRKGHVPEMWEAYRSSWVWRDDEAARERLRMSVERLESLND
ncbi:hypothetical protein BJ165DRAFT_1345625 [Panaeolus papilionaceus]|nr:hypothetical protein BJ165DRAFT_1345625 [Panaeolus papilionaceus]